MALITTDFPKDVTTETALSPTGSGLVTELCNYQGHYLMWKT